VVAGEGYDRLATVYIPPQDLSVVFENGAA